MAGYNLGTNFGLGDEDMECDLAIEKPSSPKNLALSAQHDGIHVSFNSSVDNGGSTLQCFVVKVNGKEVKRNRLRVERGIQTCVIGYIKKQEHYEIAVTLVNQKGLESDVAHAALNFKRPSGPMNLTLTAERRSIQVTFNLPEDNGGCPIKLCSIYDFSEGSVVLLHQKKIESTMVQFVLNYQQKRLEYHFLVSVENAGGFESQKITKSIKLAPPRRLTDEYVFPHGVEWPKSVSLISYLCAGYPRDVVWKKRKDGFLMTISQNDTRYQYTISDNGAECLQIKSTSYDDGGQYICEVTNHLGKCSSECPLVISGRPVMSRKTMGKVELDYHGTVKLEALVVSHPEAEYVWTVNDVIVPTDQRLELTIQHVTETDAGVYRLIARNEYGEDHTDFSVKVHRKLVFVIPGVSEFESFQEQVEHYNNITKDQKHWYPIKFTFLGYANENITSENRNEKEGSDNSCLKPFDQVYRDYSFVVRTCKENLWIKTSDLIGDAIHRENAKSHNPAIIDTYSLLGVGGGGGLVRDFLVDYCSAHKSHGFVAAGTLGSHVPLTEKQISYPPRLFNRGVVDCKELPNSGTLPDQYSTEREWLEEFMECIMGKKQKSTLPGILLTGFYKTRLQELYDMLTSALEDPTHASQFAMAPLSKADDFNKFIHPGISKVIIVATYTERMNLLHEGVDAGQVTDVFYKARDNDADIMLVCLGLPKSTYKMDKSQAKLHHVQLTPLFRSQKLLRDLATRNCFISLTTEGALTSDQVEALNAYLQPVILKKPSTGFLSWFKS